MSVEELRAKYGTGMEILDAEEHMLLSMGPQHPSTHGVLRLLLGTGWRDSSQRRLRHWLLAHRVEKSMESKTYTKALVMTDRMDYLSPMSNNLAISWPSKSCWAWKSRRAPRPFA